jgi:hypothetical protein
MSFRLPRRGAALALIGTLSAIGFAASAVPANAVTSPPEQLANYYTKTCMDGEGWLAGDYSTAPALLEECSLGSSPSGPDYKTQRWEIVVHSGYVQVVLADWPSYCVDGVEGTHGVTIQKCISSDLHQHWIESFPFGGSYASGIGVLEDSNNDECLDGTLDYGIRVMPCVGDDPHQWWQAN